MKPYGPQVQMCNAYNQGRWYHLQTINPIATKVATELYFSGSIDAFMLRSLFLNLAGCTRIIIILIRTAFLSLFDIYCLESIISCLCYPPLALSALLLSVANPQIAQ
jgi:hypothetical protein